MKFLFLAVLSFFCFTSKTYSQEQPTQISIDTIAFKEAKSLKESLKLTEEQAERILFFTKLHLMYVNGLRIIKDTSIKSASMRNEFTGYRNKIKSMLSQEQYDNYLEIIEQRKNKYKASIEGKNLSLKEQVGN